MSPVSVTVNQQHDMTSQKTWILIIVSVSPPSWKQVAFHFQSWIVRFTWWKQCNR